MQSKNIKLNKKFLLYFYKFSNVSIALAAIYVPKLKLIILI